MRRSHTCTPISGLKRSCGTGDVVCVSGSVSGSDQREAGRGVADRASVSVSDQRIPARGSRIADREPHTLTPTGLRDGHPALPTPRASRSPVAPTLTARRLPPTNTLTLPLSLTPTLAASRSGRLFA
jgi:hypothetical protein